MCKERKLFRSHFKWILLQNHEDNASYNYRIDESINALLDSEVYMVKKMRETYEISLVYKISADTKTIREFFGKWSFDFGLRKKDQWIDVTALRRRNLRLHKVNVCFVLTDEDSINHLTDGVNDHIDTITKVNFPTANQLLDFLNASTNYIFANTWGYRSNNTWNGMTGYLVRGEVEMGGSPMFFTSQRLSVVEYISSPTPTRSKFVFQQPKLSYENNLFLLSFQNYLWYGSVALLGILFLALFIITAWEWKQRNTEQSKVESSVLRPNILDIAILIFAATCQQGSHTELKGSLGRIVLLLLFVSLTFLYTSYSANIVALLQSSSSQIRTLDDLLHSRLTLGVHDTIFNRYYFSIETEPIRKAIYQTKIAPSGSEPRFMAMDEGITKMRKGLFAFHMETGVGYKFVSKYFGEGEKCGLKEIQYLQVIDPWLAVRKETPFLELFKIGTKRLQEHGLQQRENRLLYEKRPKCLGRQENFVSVSMVDCYPALLILSYGTNHLRLAKLLWKENSPKLIMFMKNGDDIDNITPSNDFLIIGDWTCPSYSTLLQKANDTDKFRNPLRWFLIDTKKGLFKFNIPIDSDVMVAEKKENSYNLYSPYKMHSSKTYRIEVLGTWVLSHGLQKQKEMNMPVSMRRRNLNGLPITTSLVISDNNTKTEIMSLRNIFVDTLSKSGYRQIMPLYDFLNATMVLIFTDTWGYMLNGSYNGMVGDLVRGRAELAGTILFITTSRLDVLEYLMYPSPPTPKFVFRQPPLSYQNNLFILPFKPVVWLCILGLVMLLIVILLITAYWEHARLKIGDTQDQTLLRPNLSDTVIMVISAISQQGSTTELKGTLGRVVMFLLFFAFVFLYTSYSANIVALLQSNSNKIRTLADLLNSKLELGAEDIVYNRYHFASATDPIRKAIYQTKIAPQGSKEPNFFSLEEGVKKMRSKPFAFNMNLGTGYRLVEKYFHEHEKCGLQEIEFIQENKPWQTCRKNSPYKEIFKIGLVIYIEKDMPPTLLLHPLRVQFYCASQSSGFEY
ncbi:unnamed protein product [Leptosia nina]|uniref:Ionotropic receptor n=1 Tax=Leptosia nina TaxID=320188 RepID=A0AAV1JFE8_9NEOP